MTDAKPNITVNVDVTNPGQFFACCGLLELADRLWPGAEKWVGVVGWFAPRRFCMLTEDPSKTLQELLAETRALTFDVGDDTESQEGDDNNDDLPVEPIRLRWNNDKPAIHLDWWTEKSIKPWAGSMKERIILRAMLDAIDPNNASPFTDLKRVLYQSPKRTKSGRPKKPAKKEPFYFDPRRGNKSHPLDCGFSPDTHKMEAECCPALEALCFIGLQRARPVPTGSANRSRYTVWSQPIAANLLGAVTCGIVPLPGSLDYVFDNYFRTDQRKHKTFSQATLERSSNG
jgi:CRISPR-associated protein Csb3